MKKLLPAAAFSLFALAGQAQLTITDSLTIGSITTLLEGIGVTVSNVTVNCPERAMGHFIGTSELAITEGLVLTTGGADLVAGPVANFATDYLGTPGDVDLDNALGMGGITYEACVLEFDCVPQGDTLLFNFSFGSEEYQEFVGSSFNDVFAIYLSGPGFGTPTNVAAIPGGTVVSINNVNALLNSGYYYDNEAPAGQYVSYDGFTTNLTVFAVVQPGQPYHFKVAIADVADGALDSGVFLEAFSFRSPMLTTAINEQARPTMQLVRYGDELTMLLPMGSAGNQEVLVFDAAGHVSQRTNAVGGFITIGIQDLSSGIYVVRIDDHSLPAVRFVKE
ncbi:MAG: T9SS type A sorting domain-containing protein [Flavobacteriales bacterium]|nr:T9SS type A sorting domain-containing protein [Flavobacteriales bacterium]MBP6698558.1 T9SS type A sorting domain-containing protein [Flavobacteriales bacterium]